ncbi:MAG: T9SS type A sorting domain-containing protein, partial [Bacteroidota bacterium]
VSGGSLVPLPLTLVSFTGQSITGGNLLTWITSSEQNTRDFEVQRDGGNGYQPLAVIPAAGNSHQNLNYSYTDATPGYTGVSTSYRLRMSDLDGKFTYSKVVVLQSPLSVLSVRILPNPFHQSLSVTVNSPQTAGGVITVTDISGKLLIKQNVSFQKGVNNLDAGTIANLPKGMYLFSVMTEGQKQTVKFVRE